MGKARCSDSPYVLDTVSKYPRELEILLSGSTVKKYKSGEVIFAQGDVEDKFYFIRQGRVMAIISGGDGTEKIVAIHDINTFVGDTALDHHPYLSTSVAILDSELCVIEGEHFRSCVKKHPEVAFMVLESVIRKARNAAVQVGDLFLRSARGRVAHILLKLSDEIGTQTTQGIVLQRRITHETLAGLTGLARPTLTGVLNDLERANAITKKDRRVIIITDKKKLWQAVDDIVV